MKNSIMKNYDKSTTSDLLIKGEGLEVYIGEIAEETWKEEKIGPTPEPNVTALREWDFKLLKRYPPFYSPVCDLCCLCTTGKCDLSKGRKGACGIDIKTQQARVSLLTSCMGTSAHAGHARHLLEHLIEKYGPTHPIDLGLNIEVEAPLIRLVLGIRPKKLIDLRKPVDYVEKQLIHLMSATNIGQEKSHLDFESKALHAGMLDLIALEVADIAQIVSLKMPKADPEAPLVDFGLGTVDTSKPVVLCIGHNVLPAASVAEYLEKTGLNDRVEICGVCCTAQDIARINPKAKVIGSLARQLYAVKSGIADVIIVDEQCVRTDTMEEAQKIKSVVIATNDKICMGLPNRTDDDPDKTVEELVNGVIPGALILDPEVVGEVAVKAALRLSDQRAQFKKLIKKEELIELAKKCTECQMCNRACPNNLPVYEGMRLAKEGYLEKLAEIYELCIGCGRCEVECKTKLPIISMLSKAGEKSFKDEKYKLRCGRGPIQDVEIRNVGRPIVFGEIPGVIAFAGCPNYPKSGKELVEIAEEFLKRRYIIVATGCSAMSLAMHKDEEGKTIYEKYPGNFDAGGIVNLGSCVTNSHAAGAAVKIASIFARRPLRANYEVISDYILNRIGAVGIVWGIMAQKAFAITTGLNRLGIPIIFGPYGSRFRRLFLGRKDLPENWEIYDYRTKEKMLGEPAPEHLSCVVETKEEAIVMAARLCIRPNDTAIGRKIKLSHYIDLSKKYLGETPSDLDLYVRSENDIPITIKEEVLQFLSAKGWKPRKIPLDPTILDPAKLHPSLLRPE
ncbi:MAG: CO dehydrogenase/acetyl-CoA synthase complex subunit alpha [Euryarchaeota archaeon]|nr:CO dehydrogenase/acetyl-CoA synthase complex subunit alpha [Euryarchaeota archaeon]